MSELATLQEWLRWVWTEPRGVEETLASPSRSRPEPRPRRLDQIVPGQPGPLRRLDVYANAYFERILGAMAGDFPALNAVLGETDFRRLTAEYLAVHPSRTYNIDDIGHALPAFLHGHALSLEKPYLEDLSRLERELFLSVYSERLPPFNSSALADIPAELWPTLKLTIDPALRLLEVFWPVAHLWRRRSEPDPTRGFSPARHPTWMGVFWDDGGLHVETIPPDEAKTLHWAKEGIPLGEMILRLGTLSPKTLQEWFAGWIQRGWVKGVRRPVTPHDF